MASRTGSPELPSQDGGAYAHVVEVRVQLRRLERFGRPVAAALSGSALGGGFEIALACHHRVGLDHGDVRWALAESTTGILPAGAGTVRIARAFGMATAVREIVGAGLAYSPAMGLARRLVDELAPTPVAVLAAARQWVQHAGPDGGGQRSEKPDYRVPGGLPGDPDFEAELAAVRTEIEARADDLNIDAIRAILEVSITALSGPVDIAFEAETQAFLRLVALPATHELGLVFAGLKRVHDRIAQARKPPRPDLMTPGFRTFELARRSPLIDVFLPGYPDRIVDITIARGASEQILVDITATAALLGVPTMRSSEDGSAYDNLDHAILAALGNV